LIVAELEIIYQHFPVGSEESNEKPTVRIARLLSQDLKPGSPE